MSHTHGTSLAEGIEMSSVLFKRFLPGFDESNRTRQAPGLPNHLAWTLGHLAMVLNRIAEKLDKKPMPASDFVEGAKGDASRFAIEAVSFKSEPKDAPAEYPSLARCLEIFDAAIARSAAACRMADDATLASTTPWGPSTITLAGAAQRMVFHNGTHCGQIVDLRRALGMKRVLE